MNDVFTLQWHITHRCNLRCRHCYQDDFSSLFPTEDFPKILDGFEALLQKEGCAGHVNVTGGEPLTHPGLFTLLHSLGERGLTFSLLTNGTLIGKSEARLLKELGVSYVQVSLDGTEKVHDRIRGEGAFDAALRGLGALLCEDVDATVAFTAQRDNLRELPKLARLLRGVGVKKLWYDRVVIPASEDEAGLSLSPTQAQRLMKKGASLQRRFPVTNGRALQFLAAGRNCTYSCQAGKRLLALLANGTVYPCRRLPLEVGNALETPLDVLFETSPLLKTLRAAGAPEGCRGCQWEETCKGGAKCVAFAKTGRWDEKDPDCPL